MSFGRLPNRFGSVSKLPGKRRKPWRARKLSSYKIDPEKGQKTAVYVNIGYYATKKEALDALAKISDLPEVVENRTLASVYEEWLKTHDVAEATKSSYKSRWAYLAPLHDRPIRKISVREFEAVLSDDRVPRTQKSATKLLLKMVYDYALKRDIVFRNTADNIMIVVDRKTRIERHVISAEEVDAWEAHNDPRFDAVVLMVYSGIRTTEAEQIKKADVHLEEGYFVCGVKTEAGRNRSVPIHPHVMPIVQRLMEIPGEKLLPDFSIRTFFRDRIKDHTPHDTRHTFVTAAHRSKMDPIIVKKIVGHQVNDVTATVYTHISVEDMRAEISKLKL